MSDRLWSVLQWPVIVFGVLVVLAVWAGVFFVLRRLVRRWRELLHRRMGRLRVSLEFLGTALVFAVWYLASRVVP